MDAAFSASLAAARRRRTKAARYRRQRLIAHVTVLSLSVCVLLAVVIF